MEDFLNELGIQGDFYDSKDGSKIMDIKDSNEYGKIYSKLDKTDLVYELEDSSQITLDNSSIQYQSDNYVITLIADFSQDIYKLTIREIFVR